MLRCLAAPALVLAMLAAPAYAEVRPLSGFTNVRAEDKLRVEVAIGPAFAVDVQGPDAAHVRTRIVRDTLEIAQLNRPWFGISRRLNAIVRVTMPSLDGVVAARGAELIAVTSGACHSFNAIAAMGATAHVSGLACDAIDATAAMGGELNLAGTCGMLDVTAAMGGEVNAGQLRCDTVDATAAMGGDVAAYANNTYGGSASMGGSIDVAGGARRGDVTAVMGGSVAHKSE